MHDCQRSLLNDLSKSVKIPSSQMTVPKKYYFDIAQVLQN